jgi:hypothetical protein
MTITRRDWWLGVAVVALALVLHAIVPRYEVLIGAQGWPLRVDRWTGTVSVPPFSNPDAPAR